jgi:hypothetical protein
MVFLPPNGQEAGEREKQSPLHQMWQRAFQFGSTFTNQ